MRSEDSQTLFLNKPDEDDSTTRAQESQQTNQSQSNAGAESEESVKKCWICFSDSTEDTPTTSAWRSPCPCALVAHEECLLDWIADMEAPNNRRANRSVGPTKIECPQCKTEIKLARPRDLIVEGVRGLERLGSQLVTPGSLTVLAASLYNSSLVWGIHSIYAVFGEKDGFRILAPILINRIRPPTTLYIGSGRSMVQQLLNVAVEQLQHWRLYVGLPLITPMLILSRTSLADSILPVMPILFFATQTPSPQDTFDLTAWPPSASLAFSLLPYVRSLYNFSYKRMWASKERQWLKQIQPRLTQDAGNGGDGNGEGGAEGEGQADLGVLAPREDDENVFEVRIDGNIWEDWEDDTDDEDRAAAAAAAVDAAVAQAEQRQNPNQQNANDQAQPAAQQNNQPANQPNPQNQRPQGQAAAAGANERGERRLSFSPTAIAETVLGALLFPTIAGVSGELLKLVLPQSWTAAPSRSMFSGRTMTKGLLQEKWGRSLVGGCLFVVLKDAVMLYVRWRMAQMHRKRSVLDYAGAKRRV